MISKFPKDGLQDVHEKACWKKTRRAIDLDKTQVEIMCEELVDPYFFCKNI